MLLQNIDVSAGWVNGRLCTVSAMHEHHIVVSAADDPTKELHVERIQRTIPYTSYQRSQFPLTLAWAFTIHKVQSLTLAKVAIDLSNMFAQGQIYVALSRVKSLQDIFIVNWRRRQKRQITYDESTLEFLQNINKSTSNPSNNNNY